LAPYKTAQALFDRRFKNQRVVGSHNSIVRSPWLLNILSGQANAANFQESLTQAGLSSKGLTRRTLVSSFLAKTTKTRPTTPVQSQWFLNLLSKQAWATIWESNEDM